LQATFGRLAIRSAYRAPAVNEFGNRHGLSVSVRRPPQFAVLDAGMLD